MNNRTFVSILAAMLLLGISGNWLVHAQRRAKLRASAKLAPGRVPPAGDYDCTKSIWRFAGAQNMDGSPMQTVHDVPSAMGTLQLDGKGLYRKGKKSGRYRFNVAKREFAFVSGPLAGWPVVYEVKGNKPTLRLGATIKDKVVSYERIGENSCDLNTKVKFPNSAPPASSGGPQSASGTDGPRNGGARGVLTLQLEGKIVDFNLQTGARESRFEGSNPFRTPRGETAFVDATGALVIAGAGGTVTATIPVPRELKQPVSVAISPDGSKIAFHVEHSYGDVVLVATRAGKIIAQFKDMTQPNWMPDGRLLVARATRAEGSQPGLFISDAALNRLKRLDPNLDSASEPAPSPDGQRIAFVHHGHIWLLNPDGSAPKQLSFSEGGEGRPAWSPDGKWIVAATHNYNVVVLISVQNGKIIEVKDKGNQIVQSRSRLNWR